MINRISFIFFLSFNLVILYSQSFPNEYYFSDDGNMLLCGGRLDNGFYNKNIIRNIYLTFGQSNYWTQLKNNYSTETNLEATMEIDGVKYNGIGARFRGNTSYMMVQNSDKKSFAIETDFINEDQSVMGYKNLKFNNAHEDPSFMKEVLYYRMSPKYAPVAKANFIHLFINNQDWGLYPNIQSIDKTFLEQWFLSNDGARFRATTEETGNPGGPGGPQWGDGTAGLNFLGTDSTVYKKYYALKSSDISDPWGKLISACDAIDKTTNTNYNTLGNKLDIDKSLWFLAIENIFTDDDSYTMKGKMDYMVYFEPETGRTTPLEYDGNSTFQSSAATSSSWGPFKNASNSKYPLLYKLMNIPEYRQRYLAHYRTILNETFTTENANKIIDEIDGQINGLVTSDPKKLYSKAQYTSELANLKSFVSKRRIYLLSNTEVAQSGPEISSIIYTNAKGEEFKNPEKFEKVNVRVNVEHGNGIKNVFLFYSGSIVGNFEKVQMYDDGNHNDIVSGDGIYGADIPGFEGGKFVRFYIEAIAANTSASASYMPAGAEHDVFVYKVANAVKKNGVVINEIMASNTKTAMDEKGEFEDWIELYNNNDLDIDLSGMFMSDKSSDLKKWKIPSGTMIKAKGYLIIWADEDTEQGVLHANFKLSKSGEEVLLTDSLSNILDNISFGELAEDISFARNPNGTGGFKIQNSTFNANNENSSAIGENININKVKFILLPNLVDTDLILESDFELNDKILQIINIRGDKVLDFKCDKLNLFNVASLPSGVYFAGIDGQFQKFIKK
jgi:hypothetical protein